MSPIQRLRHKWASYCAGETAWARFTPQDMEIALKAEAHWRDRFWNKHQSMQEALRDLGELPLNEMVELGQLRREVESLRYRLEAMNEGSPGRELINAVTRTRWFKRRMEEAANSANANSAAPSAPPRPASTGR